MRSKRLISLLLVMLLIFGSCATVMAAPQKNIDKLYDAGYAKFEPITKDHKLVKDPKVEGLSDNDEVRIIVELKENPVIEYATQKGVKVNELSKSYVRSITEKIIDVQSAVKNEISTKNIDIEYHNSFYNVVNGFSATTTLGNAKLIEKLKNVERVVIANKYERPKPQMVNSKDLINATQTWDELGYTGEGMVVAIIDTGIDSSHKDMVLTDSDNVALDEDAINDLIELDNLPGQWFTYKVPYGYNYMDNNLEILDLGPDATEHGMHVAGTVGANGDEENGGIKGVAPECQLLAMKVFGNDPNMPSTFGDIIIRAIDDSIALGADVINMSLGSTAAYVMPDDPEQVAVRRAVENGVFTAISAGNSAKFGDGWGDPFAQNPDTGVVGSPGLSTESIQVAASGNKVFLYENTVKVEGLENIIGYGKDSWENRNLTGELELIAIGGSKLGAEEDYAGIDVTGKVVLVNRGTYSFFDKTEWAAAQGAVGIIVYDHGLGSFYKNQGGWSIPFMMISKTNGLALEDLLVDGSITINVSTTDESIDPETGALTDFSSWGVTPSLDFKPEITAPGGNIYSTANNDGYQYMSGTSMASPHVAGGGALVLQRVEEEFNLSGSERIEMAKNLIMSTATPVSERFEYTSPRRQGAGMMNLLAATTTPTIITDSETGLSKVNLKEMGDVETFTLTIENFSDESVTYAVYGSVSTDLAIDGGIWGEPQPVVNVDEEGNETTPIAFSCVNEKITVPANDTAEFAVTIDLTNAVDWAEWMSLKDKFTNGTFVEGFIQLKDINDDNDDMDLSIPYIGFYGDWDQAPIIDGSVYDDSSFYEATGMLDNEDYYLGVNSADEWDASNIAISPNGDGYRDSLIPVMSFLRNARELDINILDSNKEKVRDLAIEEYLRKDYFDGGYGSYCQLHDIWEWDGTVNNVVAKDGQYYYEIKTKIDYPGAKWQTVEFPVMIDTVAPVIEKWNYDKVNKNLTVAANDTGSSISDYVLLEEGQEPILSTEGVFDLSNLSNAPHVFELIVVDYAGNEAIYENKVAIGDSTIPYIDMPNPEAFGVYNTNIVPIIGFVKDATGLVELKINNGQMAFTQNEETGDFEFETALAFEQDGAHVIDIDALDNAGNHINFERTIYTDTTLPVITMTNEPSDTVVEYTVESIRLAGEITDNLCNLKVYMNGNMIENIEKDFVSYPEELKPVTFSFDEDCSLEFGQNILRIEAIDVAGNKTFKEYYVYKKQQGEVDILTLNSFNLNPDKEVSSERPLTISAMANKSVSWDVSIIDLNGEVVEKFEADGDSFNKTWVPDEFKKLNGEYKVSLKATSNGSTVTDEKVFTVYNYPIKINAVNVIKKGAFISVEAEIENLGPQIKDPMLVIQVTDENGYVVNISTASMEGQLAGQTIKLSSGFGISEAGTYKVDVYVWTGWDDASSLSSPETTTFEVQ